MTTISVIINANKITVIPNSTPKENQISEQATDCIFIGRIEDEKGNIWTPEG
jgi:hypothetical protein